VGTLGMVERRAVATTDSPDLLQLYGSATNTDTDHN